MCQLGKIENTKGHEYENMKEALKEVESKKILQSIQNGLNDMKSGKTKAISLRPSENNII